MSNKLLKIGEAAELLNINPKTLRYYEEMGLIPQVKRSESGYRLYSQADLDHLTFILRARELCLSLSDIDKILRLRAEGEVPCPHVAKLIDQQISAVDEEIKSLKKLRDELTLIQHQAKAISLDESPSGDCICQLIEK